MKFPRLPLAGTLLVLYAVYSTFVPVSIAHSIILFSLALLAGFELYIHSIKTPSMEKTIASQRDELLGLLEQQRSELEVKLQKLLEEQQKQAILRANASSTSSTTKKNPITF